MYEFDTPITARDLVKVAVVVISLLVLGVICVGVLYVMACANMPTGCH